MSQFTYTANLDADSFVSAVILPTRTMYIGDTLDLDPSEVDLMAQFAVLEPGAQVVDLSDFPYALAAPEPV